MDSCCIGATSVLLELGHNLGLVIGLQGRRTNQAWSFGFVFEDLGESGNGASGGVELGVFGGCGVLFEKLGHGMGVVVARSRGAGSEVVHMP